MRKPLSAIFAGLVFLLGAACSPQNETAEHDPAPAAGEETPGTEEALSDEESGVTVDDMRAEALAQIDQEACRAGGGEVRPEGMLGMPRCVTSYADAGEECRDASDCDGRCLADDSVTDYEAPAGEQRGLCEANDSPFGCYGEINDGAAGGFICVD